VAHSPIASGDNKQGGARRCKEVQDGHGSWATLLSTDFVGENFSVLGDARRTDQRTIVGDYFELELVAPNKCYHSGLGSSKSCCLAKKGSRSFHC
jgi:hypothetical protein